MMEFSRTTRERDLATLPGQTFDLAVIGGGITGAGIARDAAFRGLTTLLVDQGDFASGTSSRSSRLVHGGLRYLEHGHFRLVFEALSERRILRKIAPHLVTPLEFFFPVYHGDRNGPVRIGLGLALYDALSLFGADSGHRRLSVAESLALVKGLNPEGLAAGFTYADARTDDARLVLENVIDARENGAVALNYVRAEERRRESRTLQRLDLADKDGGRRVETRARLVVNATGAWCGDLAPAGTAPLVRPTKGVHLVVPRDRLPVDRAVVMQDHEAVRILFAIPWETHTILGTTDTEFRGSPGDARVEPEDVDYLLRIANRTFPGAALTTRDVVSAWAGVRPLLADSTREASNATREHRIVEHEPGFVSILGGKLTTYRKMAAETLDLLIRTDPEGQGDRPACRTDRTPLPGSRGFPITGQGVQEFEADLGRRFGIDPETARHLRATYGIRASDVLAGAAGAPEGLRRLVPELPVLQAELYWSLLREGVVHPADFLLRRSSLWFKAVSPASAAEKVARLMAGETGGGPGGLAERN